MKRVIFYMISSISVLAWSSERESSLAEEFSQTEAGEQSSPAPEVRFRMPLPNQAEIEAQIIKDYRAQQAALEKSPWITKSGQAAYQGSEDARLEENYVEQQKIADIAFAHLNELNILVQDGLKILIESTGSIGLVTIEAVVPEGHLGAAFTFKITLNLDTGEVIQLLAGG